MGRPRSIQGEPTDGSDEIVYTFLAANLMLVIAYFIYGAYVEKQLGLDPARVTPAHAMTDGVDYVPLSTWRVFLIQLLNIAGLGPVFGAILGALYGPVALLWIVFGGIFAGAVHDLVSARISLAMKGASLTEIIASELGSKMRLSMIFVTIALLIAVGVVFVSGPARLMTILALDSGYFGEFTKEASNEKAPAAQSAPGAFAASPTGPPNAAGATSAANARSAAGDANVSDIKMTAANIEKTSGGRRIYVICCILIFIYYFAATIFPIDVLIGRIYPFFGMALLAMCMGVVKLILFGGRAIPELTLANLHPGGLPIWPGMMITIACGAISGFHATQSPIMTRAVKSEKHTRLVFMGAMLVESFIALVWATAAYSFFGGTSGLLQTVKAGTPAHVVNEVCKQLGHGGMLLALLGVIVLPITSGDTAYRSARLILADLFCLDQKPIAKRLMLALPIFTLGGLLTAGTDFMKIWNYFAWLNQSLSVFTLFACSVYLARHRRNYYITLVPALFMSLVCFTFFFASPEFMKLGAKTGTLLAGVMTFLLFHLFTKRRIADVREGHPCACETSEEIA
jgi:carbon starvation protein CstA